MVSSESFNKFMEDLAHQIEDVDKANKQKVEDKLKAISENYRQRVSERLAIEMTSAEECRKIGDQKGERHHLVLAEIYRSLFSVQTTT
ncbi:MAG: hypothetical protein AUH37_00035 [Candidatus Nitrososphaera sp. 13_1_40CM_48_12]|nr:MAG: hypothetical protein AUH71_06255 [Thaumarchaeota archaeon 13_1_40CM_4_48_7]OLC26772.1 MAG: hypothetical protein AUH37_00035 [Candidatus Nitrososphaera sp. 13_1_40CM_48_12]